ncbi:LOW QUALITY PROTEIN: hypothetical protein HMPREF0005_05919, partial [Achromobacter xylosoxidans C54]
GRGRGADPGADPQPAGRTRPAWRERRRGRLHRDGGIAAGRAARPPVLGCLARRAGRGGGGLPDRRGRPGPAAGTADPRRRRRQRGAVCLRAGRGAAARRYLRRLPVLGRGLAGGAIAGRRLARGAIHRHRPAAGRDAGAAAQSAGPGPGAGPGAGTAHQPVPAAGPAMRGDTGGGRHRGRGPDRLRRPGRAAHRPPLRRSRPALAARLLRGARPVADAGRRHPGAAVAGASGTADGRGGGFHRRAIPAGRLAQARAEPGM